MEGNAKESRQVLPFRKGAVQQPGNDGQVLALIVRRKDHRVLVKGLFGDGHHASWAGLQEQTIE